MKRFIIPVCITFLLLHLCVAISIGQVLYGYGKLKNSTGIVTSTSPNVATGTVDSVRYSGYFDVSGEDVFYLYSKGSVLMTITSPPLAPGRTVFINVFSVANSNFHSTTLSATNSGSNNVTCVFADTSFASTDGGISWHTGVVTTATFSYSRTTLQFKLSDSSSSGVSNECFIGSFKTPSSKFSYHYWIDGHRVDSFWVKYYLRYSKKYTVTDAKGSEVSSSFPAGYDTTQGCPAVPKPGSYLAKLTFIPDSMLVVPDSVGITYHFNINPGIYQSQCKGLPFISFDATHSNVPDTVESPDQTGTGWQGGAGIGVIQDSGTIFLNGGTLRFHGIMEIDTVNSWVSANGEFYVFTKLPLTQKAGAWKLGTGIWPTLSYSCNGLVAITQSILSSDSIGGFPFRIDSIYFITDSLGLSGVRLGATLRIPNVTIGGECASSFTGKTSPDISLAPIEITREGIGGALHVSNVGVGDVFCIKDMFGAYYEAPDSLSFGAEFKAPFVDKLALSAGWVRGVWDAVSFNVQQATGGIPIGETTMLLSGVRGSASGWNNPPLKCSLGGTFDNVVPNFMRWEGDVSYLEPSTLKGSLTLKFLNVLDWQAVMNATATLDWNHYVKFEGSLKEGTLGNGYVFNGNGSLTFTWNPKVDLIGRGGGSYSIPKIAKPNLSAITDWINSYLPIQIASAEMYLKSGVVKSNISFWIISAHLAVDLHLPYTDPNFIDFGRGTIPLGTARPSGKDQIGALTPDSIHMPINCAFAVIRIRSNGLPSVSSLIDPSNISHTNAPTDSLIQYMTDPNTNHGFWIVKNPAPGVWKLSMAARTSTDTVDAEVEPVEQPLQFSASQVSNRVTLHWIPLYGDTANVTVYLADNPYDYKGFLFASANDKDGILSFTLNDSLPNCQYYLYAMRDNGAYISTSYANIQLDNHKSFSFPTNVRVMQLGGDTVLLKWEGYASDKVRAFAIKVTDAIGNDSIYGSVSSNQDSMVLVIKDQSLKHISVIGYSGGLQTCWSQAVPVAASVAPSPENPERQSFELHIWPNPTTGKSELRFSLSERMFVHAAIFDILGKEISSVVQGTFDAGSHTLSFDLGAVNPGTYYCRIQSSSGSVETQKLVIEH